MSGVDFVETYLSECNQIIEKLPKDKIRLMVQKLSALRDRKGRLFVLGVGGSAANASHAVNDFRKLCGIETYSPSDNVSELTARVNDEGWGSSYSEWLKGSNLNQNDMIFVLSVGGGNKVKKVSLNIVSALDVATKIGADVIGIVGKEVGYTQKIADPIIIIPEINPARVTPHSEAFQAVIWHCLVSHPLLQLNETKW